MALSPGTRLGHYDVTSLLGEGGMGQVWQATDTQLNRQVALKILPDAFADDPDRLARFTREAQILASLNHPNIAAIHGIEESEGTRALVLELVEGPTLADRIAKGPVPVDEALPIAKQIAEALEAAHEAGVIHRDLKPANIKVREDGTVKVLDFGLAKALDPNPEGDPSQSPTLTAAATQMGVIMGTAAYMSPEQARGKAVDKRADIWALGVVLYEMLTGRRPFAGDDVSKTLAHVIALEPDWDALPDSVPRSSPPSCGAVWRRCQGVALSMRPGRTLDRLGHLQMQPLPAWQRQPRRERLPDQRVRELPARHSARHRQDQVVRLRFLERREQGSTGHVPDRLQQRQTEAATDHGAERQHLLAVWAHSLEAPADDQPNPFRNVQFLEVEIRTPGAILTVQRSLVLEMLIDLLDEERVPLRLPVDAGHERLRWRRPTKRRQHPGNALLRQTPQVEPLRQPLAVQRPECGSERPVHVQLDIPAISEFPKWRKYLISLSFRGQSSVRPVQVGGFDVNIVIHRSTAVRGRGGPARHDAWPPSLGAILAHTDGPCGS